MFYRILPFLARVFGAWTFDLIARGIAAGYFFFAPRRVIVSSRFYRALFPQRSWIYHFRCTWKQFQNFTSVYLDRYLFQESGDISYTYEGWERIENALDRKTGGIILMSHHGNWEIAAHLMKRKREQMPLLLFMGQRAEAHIARIQKDDLQRVGIRVVAAEKNGGTSPRPRRFRCRRGRRRLMNLFPALSNIHDESVMPEKNPSFDIRPLIKPWGGDVPEGCHGHFLSATAGKLPWPEAPREKVEVAVVGAGLSGLTAAYHLRDRQVVVLEAESHPGGVCLPGSYQGIPYPAGSAYFYYPWNAHWQKWYRDRKLDVDSALVAAPASALFYRGEWIPDCFSEAGLRALPLPSPVVDKLLALAGELAPWEEAWEPLGSEALIHPELDRFSLRHYLEEVRGLPPEVTGLFAPYCASRTASSIPSSPRRGSSWPYGGSA